MGAAKVGAGDSKLKGWVLRMRGLPFTATADDVVGFFDGVEVAGGTDGVVFTCTADGRPVGEAYVEFPTEAAQKEALKKHKAKLGARYIELFQSSKGDMYQAISQNAYYLGHNERRVRTQGSPALQPPPNVAADGSTLKLRGLPYTAGVDDVTEFFNGTIKR
jgi:hypothetical protein